MITNALERKKIMFAHFMDNNTKFLTEEVKRQKTKVRETFNSVM